MEIKELKTKLIDNTPSDLTITFEFVERNVEVEMKYGFPMLQDQHFDYDYEADIGDYFNELDELFDKFIIEYKITENTTYTNTKECWIEFLQDTFRKRFIPKALESVRKKCWDKEIDYEV